MAEWGERTQAPDGNHTLVMVTYDGAFGVSFDAAKKTWFEDLGYTVTAIDDSSSQATYDAQASKDVMFISESVSSTEVAAKPLSLDMGIIVEDAWVWDDVEFADVSDAAFWGENSFTLQNDTHYITSTLSSGTSYIYTSDGTDLVGCLPRVAGGDAADGVLASGAVLLGTEDTHNSECLFAFETGADLDTGTAVNRRVGIPTHFANLTHWTDDMKTIVERSLYWVKGEGTIPATIETYEWGDRVYTASLPGGDAIEILNSKQVNDETSSTSFTQTAGGNRMLVVALTYEGSDQGSTVSYNGTGMTAAASFHQASGPSCGVEYYILKEADLPGTGNVVVSTTNTGYSMSIWLLDDVLQSENYYDFDYDTSDASQTDSTTPNINVTASGIILTASAWGGGGATANLTNSYDNEYDLTGTSYKGVSGDKLTVADGTDYSDWNADPDTFRHVHAVMSFRNDPVAVTPATWKYIWG